VVGLAYDEIRAMIVDGPLGPGDRLGQAELSTTLGISRTSVREALRRLTGDGLVRFEVNRGFFVTDVGLDRVLEHLEARLVLEPGIAQLAAVRASKHDLEAMAAAIEAEKSAPTSAAAHDASRAFHVAIARAAQNPALLRLFESLWIADVGRRLLAQRRREPTWQGEDSDEHRAILAVLARGDGEKAASLMRAHVSGAIRHWSR
jgi:DNA-binding GntR family transcriptional regulator